MTTVLEQSQEVWFESFRLLEPNSKIRQHAMERFGELGFPTTKDEEWRFTNVAPIARIPFRTPQAGAGKFTWPVLDFAGSRLVFVNGRFSPELSATKNLPRGVRAGSLAEAMAGGVETHVDYHDRAFVALNTAFFEDGAFVQIPNGTVIDAPIYVLYLSSGDQTVTHPRTLILAGRDCQAAVIEGYTGRGKYFTNAVSEVVAGENSVIEHYKLQQESEQAFHVATLQILQERSSTVTDHSIAMGGALVRNDINVTLDGQGAECTLNGLYVTKGDQHVDNHTQMDHAKPHCASREYYKGILDGRSSGVFNGGIIVRKDAQKTDAKQSNKNMLLSEDAVINTKPQLQIWADDVRCTHGATIGQIDPEAVFYLRSRGMDLASARSLLTYAFSNDVLSRMKVEEMRRYLEAEVLAQLNKGL